MLNCELTLSMSQSTTLFDWQVKEALLAAPGRILLTADTWTSLAQEAFLAVTAHWITEDFKMKHVLLDFCDLPASHTALNLKDSVLEILNDFEIAHKILGFTIDGATNMNVMFNLLQPCLQLERQRHGASTESKLIFREIQILFWNEFDLVQNTVLVSVFLQLRNSEYVASVMR